MGPEGGASIWQPRSLPPSPLSASSLLLSHDPHVPTSPCPQFQSLHGLIDMHTDLCCDGAVHVHIGLGALPPRDVRRHVPQREGVPCRGLLPGRMDEEKGELGRCEEGMCRLEEIALEEK